MDVQIIAKLVLVGFHNSDISGLQSLCSDYVDRRLKYLSSSQKPLDVFLWDSFFKCQSTTSPEELLDTVQLFFDSSLEPDELFPKQNIRFLIPDIETQLCILISSLKLGKGQESHSDGNLAVVLLKENSQWRYHNLIKVVSFQKSDSSIPYYSSLEEALSNFKPVQHIQESLSDDQLDIGDYWGSSSEDEVDNAKERVKILQVNNPIPLPQTSGFTSTETQNQANIPNLSLAKKTDAVTKTEYDTKAHFYNILRSTYALARSQNITSQEFEEMARKVSKEN